MKELMTGVGLMLLSLITIFWVIPNSVQQLAPAANIALSPSFWPLLCTYFIFILSILLSLQACFNLMAKKRKKSTKSIFTLNRGNKKTLIATLMLLFYYWLSLKIGLLIASTVTLAAYSALAGERSLIAIAAWAIGAPLALTLFFSKVAQVLIPVGPLRPFF